MSVPRLKPETLFPAVRRSARWLRMAGAVMVFAVTGAAAQPARFGEEPRPRDPAPAYPPVLLPGKRVEVYARDGRWYPAVIVGVTPAGWPRVQYEGYGPDETEVVDPRAVREPPAAPPEEPEPALFEAGQKVEVFARNRWFPATVLRAEAGQVEVQYDGTAHTEWVRINPEWLRPAQTAQPAPSPSPAQPVPGTVPPLPAPGAVPVAPPVPAPAAAPSASATPEQAPAGARTPPPGLYLMERDLAGVLERRVFLFEENGAVFENPSGGLQPFDAAAFRSANPARAGRARLSRGEMEIVWEGGRLPAAAPYEETADGFNWDLGSFRKLTPTPAAQMTGVYQAGAAEPIRTSDGWTMGGTGMRLELGADGSFRRFDAGGVLTGEGVWTLDGFTLTLDNRGVKTRHCAVRYTAAGGSETGLYFDGQFLRLQP